MDCDKPVLWVCRYCPATDVRRCSSGRESACGPCSARYRRRVRRIALSGAPGEGQRGYFGTLTAIGERVHCKRAGCDAAPACGHELCSCTTEDSPDLADWNAGHSRRWNHFRTLLRRECPDLEFMRGVEVQDGKRRRDGRGRGALHDHFLMRTRYAVDERTIRRLAMQAGFGHSVDLADAPPGSAREAYYVSKYVTKSTDSRDRVPWRADVVDVETGEVTRQLVPGRYRTWSASRQWGLTMAQIRAEASVYAAGIAEQRAEQAERDALVLIAQVLGAELVETPSGSVPPAPS